MIDNRVRRQVQDGIRGEGRPTALIILPSTFSVHVMRRLLSCCLVFFMFSGCGSDSEEETPAPPTPEVESAIKLGYRDGLAQGKAAGHKLGHIEGVKAAKSEALKTWGPIGLGFGAALGALVVLFAARGPLKTELKRRQESRRIKQLIGRAPTNLDPAIRAQVIKLAERLVALGSAVDRDGSEAGAELRSSLAPQLASMGETVLKLARLNQGLKIGQLAAGIKPKRVRERILKLEKELKHAPASADALNEAIAAERSKLQTHEKTATHLRRCTLKFETLAAVLDESQMSLANLAALENAQVFDVDAAANRVRAELLGLENALSTAATELATL